MQDQTIPALVELHNTLIASLETDRKPLNSWKKKKADLISIIEELELLKQAATYEGFRRPTIRATAIALLCHVESVDEEDGRTVGTRYNDIIDIIKSLFPQAKTSVACLRWYVVKIRAEEKGYEGLRLPQKRPRASKPRKVVAE